MSEDDDKKPDFDYEDPITEVLYKWMDKFEGMLIERGLMQDNPYEEPSISSHNLKVRLVTGVGIGILIGTIIAALTRLIGLF